MPDIDLSTLTPREQDLADSVVVMKEGSPDSMGLVPRARFQSAAVITGVPSSDQADFAPSGFNATTGTIKLQPTTNSFLSGIAAGATDQELQLINDSDFVVCLTHEDAASTAENRFKQGNLPSTWLLPQEQLRLRYSATLARWVVAYQQNDPFSVRPRTALTLPGTAAIVQAMGMGATASTATVSTNNPTATPTNDFAEAMNYQVSNSTAAGSASSRLAQTPFLRGATAGRQGIFHSAVVRFTALGAASGAVRAGLLNSSAASVALNSVMTQCLLLGADTSMTSLRIFRGDGAAGTPTDLGANFPVPSATAAYEYCFYCPPGAAIVHYMVRRLDTRFVALGTFTTNIPTNTTGLGHRLEVMVGATGAANTAQATHMLTLGL